MSDRGVPFDEDAICDVCGKNGAFDFMGDYLCPDCSHGDDNFEACNRCGHEPCICGM